MKEGSFMWAVEMMKQGKKVRRFIASKEEVYGLDSTRNFVIQSVLNKNKFNRVGISMVEYEATDWEVVEEPKKTLSDKSYRLNDDKNIFKLEKNGELYFKQDIKEALKEFIDRAGHIALGDIKGLDDVAKETFGKELIGDEE